MSLLCYLFFLFPGICNGFLINYEQGSKTLSSCIKNIIKQYYEDQITYVDINSGDSEVLKTINTISRQLVISRTTSAKLKIPHRGYLIFAGNSKDFIKHFSNLKQEATWNPSKKFIIIVKKVNKNELSNIFHELLVLHVNNVIVINGTNTAEIYTYNAFENYACGKYFERIIEFGQCLNLNVKNLFPNKFITGFSKCTFTAAVPHFPPFSIFPDRNELKMYLPGTEQFAFEMIADQEKFKINYSYIDFADTFSTVDEDMTATGILNFIETNKSDIVVGYLILTHTRAMPFEYLYAHQAYTDEFTYIVHRAGNVPTWMNMYVAFNFNVWFLLIISLISTSVFIIFLLRADDKVAVVLKLWGNLLLQGHNFQRTNVAKFVVIIWVWFAFFMNSFYQSSLVSLTTHPSKEYQVSTENEMSKYNYRPCVPPALQSFLYSHSGMTFKEDTGHCEKYVQGIQVVSNNEGLYTISSIAHYQFNRHLFQDSAGNMKVYAFSRPLMKIIYAIFLYKGFPLYQKLHTFSLRLRENGLMDRYFRYLYYNQASLHHQTYDNLFKARIIVPWNILLVGCTIATIIFILEILYTTMIII